MKCYIGDLITNATIILEKKDLVISVFGSEIHHLNASIKTVYVLRVLGQSILRYLLPIRCRSYV